MNMPRLPCWLGDLTFPLIPSTNTDMKSAIAGTLIFLGALLLSAPALSDYHFWQSFHAWTYRPGVSLSTMYSLFGARMGAHEQLAYWSTGCALFVAAFPVWRNRSPNPDGKILNVRVDDNES
jgi:hypothetical protein